MNEPTFAQLLQALHDLTKDIEWFNPRGYESKRQMRRARGKWKAARRSTFYRLV